MARSKYTSLGYSAIDIANKIVAKVNEKKEQGETISNLKLQKLLYYTQGYFIAAYNTKLFDDPIEAWQYGPVVRSAYRHFNIFGSDAIKFTKPVQIKKIIKKEYDLFFDAVLNEYCQFSAIKLMQMTHEESPWKETFRKKASGIISDQLLKDYFSTQIA